MSQIQISGLLLHLRDKANKPKNAIFHHFNGKTMWYGSWLAIQPENITVDKQNILIKVI